MWASPWAAGPARNLLQCGLLSMGCIFLHGTSSCSAVWFSVGYRVDVCCIMVLHELQVKDFIHNPVLGCKAISALPPEAPTPTPSQTWVSEEVIFSLFCLLLPHSSCVTFLSFLNMIPKSCHQHYWWAQLWPGVSPFRNGYIQHRGISLSLLPLLPKLCNVNSIKFTISSLPKVSNFSFPRKRQMTYVINWNKNN